MRIMWKYILPLRWRVALPLLLAGLAQTLTLVDPVIFGIIIDQYALSAGENLLGEPEAEPSVA
jgi:ATP-binding cassette subfamily B protein